MSSSFAHSVFTEQLPHSRQCAPCWGTVISTLEIVHVLLGSVAQQERSKPPSHHTSNSVQVPADKTWPSRPRMLLISRTSCSCHPLPETSLPPSVPVGISYTFSSTRPSLMAGWMGPLSNDRVASSGNPGPPDSPAECRAAVIWMQCALPPCSGPFHRDTLVWNSI